MYLIYCIIFEKEPIRDRVESKGLRIVKAKTPALNAELPPFVALMTFLIVSVATGSGSPPSGAGIVGVDSVTLQIFGSGESTAILGELQVA